MIDPAPRGGMTTVLFHSYHYPPIGGSGAQRPLKMSRYLAEAGYDLVVVTGGGATEDRWAPADQSLTKEIPAGVALARTPPSPNPETSTRWRGRLERWTGRKSRWAVDWIAESVELGATAGADADLVYVWMQPYVSAEAGVALSRRLRVPWIADLGDPWALDEMMVYPSALHRRLDLRRMGKLLGTAAAIIMSTPEAARRLVTELPALGDRPVVAISNGFDAADFAGEPEARCDGKFRLVHTGYLHTELGREFRQTAAARRALRGAVAGVDILTRSHVFLVQAINRLLAREPSLAGVLELHLAGVLTDADREVAATCPVVHTHGYVDHARSIELMRSADLLFLPMQNLPAGVRATIVPGKTYEYLASRTPILGAVPDGDARDILAAAGNALLVRPDDVEGMTRALAQAIERRRLGEAPPRPRPDVVARYEYRALAAALARVFDEVLERDATAGGREPASAAADGAYT